jgi:hypothetical protein
LVLLNVVARFLLHAAQLARSEGGSVIGKQRLQRGIAQQAVDSR